MTETPGNPPAPKTDESAESSSSGNWPVIYAVVLGSFVLWVVLLTALSRAFS